MRKIALPSGELVPVLGQGTWRMGEHAARRKDEVAALRLGLELGVTLIDTAEMYGDGGAEKIVGEAIAGKRERVFLVSKVYPHNASRKGTVEACERSLRRLGTDRLDLYLLHWRGSIPLAETVEAFVGLRQAGKIRHYGVSNFDTADMKELRSLAGGREAATNQVLYNLKRRGIEWDLLPWCREHGTPVMAYSPVDQAKLARDRTLGAIGARHGVSAAQVALAWVLSRDGIIAIPKATEPEHVRENRAALDIALSAEDLAEIDRNFPAPKGRVGLEML